MTTPEEIAARREAFEDDDDNRRPDYPAAVRTIVTAVRDLAAVERERDELRAECADRESERADLRDRVTKAEAEVERLRDTNARLNRRAQVAESCINSLVSANPAKGRASKIAREVWERCMESHAKAFHRHEAADRAQKAEATLARVEALIDGADPAFGAVTLADIRAALEGGGDE